ncbi:hypothetical protein N7465_011862 [Penicillium sp. CMV-2018d]|nr:hypothetical protein N7465_011862 [Penicillium sp. CMV-2018d]
MRNFLTSLDNKFRDLHPERTELDWENGTRKPVKSPAARRAAQGQLCGVEAPANQEYTSCAEGKKNTFDHCRIVFTKEQAQWTWACANCVFVGAGHKCSFRPDRFLHVPSWVVTAVSEREPSSPTLYAHYPTMRADATQTSLIRGNPVLNMTPASSKDAAEENPPKGRKLKIGPVNPSEGAAKDAPPKLKNGGLPFNATWYNSPLEDPKVYRMKDKVYALDTYRDLADIIARARGSRSYEGSIAQERVPA